jgi:hypothetical protein
VVSPKYIIDEYVEKLKRKATIRPGERVVRRLAVHLPEGSQDFEVFIASYRSKRELVEALSRYPVVLIEETPPRVFDVKVVGVNGVPFTGTPISIEGDKSVTLVIEGIVKSEEEFEVVVEVKALSEDSKVVAKVDSRVKVPGNYKLRLVLDKVGEFNVFISGYEPKGYRSPELHIARVRVRGELCRDILVSGVEIAKWLETAREALRMEVKSIAVKGRVARYAISHLREVLEDLAKLRVVVSGSIVQRTSSGEYVKAEFKNANTSKIARVIASLGVEEDLEVDMEFANVTLNTLASARIAREKLLGYPLAPLVTGVITECKKI